METLELPESEPLREVLYDLAAAHLLKAYQDGSSIVRYVIPDDDPFEPEAEPRSYSTFALDGLTPESLYAPSAAFLLALGYFRRISRTESPSLLRPGGFRETWEMTDAGRAAARLILAGGPKSEGGLSELREAA